MKLFPPFPSLSLAQSFPSANPISPYPPALELEDKMVKIKVKSKKKKRKATEKKHNDEMRHGGRNMTKKKKGKETKERRPKYPITRIPPHPS
ncbi:unnamed protein product [Tuber melanosporum]|jgi:hypothetical protein|uniref:(Perigord truffle) hypothetical protein n=1 Tax=Tuber melanosporum (strain Mel28) TaxID=656061 RepID=D5GH93_TUBMM|nr:uncharacterized protein GSTUM_00007802001 [Tuber melanosporum]CAZ83918.1 unnamed protein product [Tuber melanosporum]